MMEHRWGRRIALRSPVRLIGATGDPVIGQTENISISGALVRTARPVSLGALVELEFVLPGRLGREPDCVAAHVVRRTRDGAAIEWSDLAPRTVRALLVPEDASARHAAREDAARAACQDFKLPAMIYAERIAPDRRTAVST